MNAYELIRKLQQKMQDPIFARKFNNLANEVNNFPGLQQEIMRISQISNEKERDKAIEKLPDKVKKSVAEMLKLLNS